MNQQKIIQSESHRQVLQFPYNDKNEEHDQTEISEFEGHVKDRLQYVTDLVAGFASSPSNLVLVEKRPVREALEELMVKEAALQWIVRVASHSEGPIREKLWDDIDKAVMDLEKIANVYKTYAKMVINYSNPSRLNLQNENGGRVAS
jgi:hypothetical protein